MLRKLKEANRTRHEKTHTECLHEESEIVKFLSSGSEVGMVVTFQVRAFTTLGEDLSVFPTTTVKQPMATCSSSPGHLMASSGLHRHHSHACISPHHTQGLTGTQN